MPDIVNIGLYPTAHKVASALADDFTSLIDVGRFAFAVAIEKNLFVIPDHITKKESKRSIWNIGSIDPDGKMASLVASLYENVTEPYKYIEMLINTGLIHLHESSSDSSINICKYL